MKILVVGGGGREHAIVWKLSQSPYAPKIYCAPGNGGIAALAECIGIKADDVGGICAFAVDNRIDLVVIGPDDPLALGLADACEAAGIRAFGPCKAAARLEWSKSYAKDLMTKYGVPTAGYLVCNSADDALAALDLYDASGAFCVLGAAGPTANTYVTDVTDGSGPPAGAPGSQAAAGPPCPGRYPLVVKADGLALGKGVLIAADRTAAEAAIRSIMLDKAFGEAGSRIVLEQFLSGPEMTILAFTDGKVIKPMLCSQDHKRAFDGDLGPNTGGMGAFAPTPLCTEPIRRECEEKIFGPTLEMLQQEHIDYRGVLYFGLMLTEGGVKVIEYNSRFGDPETQVILPLMQNDLIDVFDAVIDGKLDGIDLKWKNQYCACVVAASGGYPDSYGRGYEISINNDITQPQASPQPKQQQQPPPQHIMHTMMFHAGTALQASEAQPHAGTALKASADGRKLVTSGGRVLGVTALGDTLAESFERAYAGIACVSFKNMYYRKDIGKAYRE